METIGLIAAMSSESDALLRYVKGGKRVSVSHWRGIRFHQGNRDCLLVTSGMGLKNAMGATDALLLESKLDLLISFGIAGAVIDDLNIGDVVLCGKTCLLEKDSPGQVQQIAALSVNALNAISKALTLVEARLVTGTAITTRGAQVPPQRLEQMTHPVLDMETAGISQIASKAGIPLIAIRSISDGPKAPNPFDLEVIFDDNYKIRIGRVLAAILHQPQIILRFRHMVKNTWIAADHAARAVFAMINEASAIISLAS